MTLGMVTVGLGVGLPDLSWRTLGDLRKEPGKERDTMPWSLSSEASVFSRGSDLCTLG